MPRESWTHNPRYGTDIDLNYCEFGFEVTSDCHLILCKFRTVKREAPEKPMESCRPVCPREMEYEPTPGVAPLPPNA